MPWLSDTRSQIAVPISMRNRLLGVIVLESERPDAYDEANVSFVKWLASRAAIVLDSARLYREADRRADDMATLYSASRTISSSLERSEVLTNAAQSIASVLNVSGAILADYRADQQQLTITVYRLGTARHRHTRTAGISIWTRCPNCAP
jgi:sigma-B regulation protein RsbU (phosphoserine phosphatase)